MSAEQVRELREKRKRREGGDKWFKMKPGTYILRVGPPWKKNGEIWKDVFFHGRYKNRAYCAGNDVNSKTGRRKKCPICMRLRQMKKEKRTRLSKKLYGLLIQKVEGLWNVLEAKKLESGKVILRKPKKFKVMRLSGKWHNLLLDIFSEEEYRSKSILGVASPRHGRFIKARRTGEEKDTEYNFIAMPNSSSLSKSKSERKAILASLNDLDELVHGSSQEELEAFLRKSAKRAKNVLESEEDEDEKDDHYEEEEEDEPRRKKKNRDEDEDEDEDEEEDEEKEDEDEDDEDAEEAYREMKKHAKKKKKKKEDDDDEEEEEDEEDEED